MCRAVRRELGGSKRDKGDIQYALYSIHYTVYIIQYTLYSIHYTVYIIQYTLYSIHYTVYIIQYTLYSIHYTVYIIQTQKRGTRLEIMQQQSIIPKDVFYENLAGRRPEGGRGIPTTCPRQAGPRRGCLPPGPSSCRSMPCLYGRPRHALGPEDRRGSRLTRRRGGRRLRSRTARNLRGDRLDAGKTWPRSSTSSGVGGSSLAAESTRRLGELRETTLLSIISLDGAFLSTIAQHLSVLPL